MPIVRPSHSGLRTCIGCGTRDERSALVRVVADSGSGSRDGSVAIVPDVRGVRPGRGAWLHPDAGCLQQAVRRRAFGRALRLTQAVGLDEVQDLIARRTAGAQSAPDQN